MRRGVRNGIVIALALLLGIFLLFFFRLDADVLQAGVADRVAQLTGQTMRSGKPVLSLLHGVSLKLPKVQVGEDAGDWRLAADVARIDFSLLSLLGGSPQITDIDLARPVLHMRQSKVRAAWTVPVLPEGVKKLRIRNGRMIDDAHSQVLAEDISGEMRFIARERKSTWEVQSRLADGDFSSQGYMLRGESGHDEVFGRISADKLDVGRLPFLPSLPLPYNRLDASLTFSLGADRQWRWAGNLSARDRRGALPDLIWRGKINARNGNDFSLYDALLHVGETTRLRMDGGCRPKTPCSFSIKMHKADAATLLHAFSQSWPLTATLDGAIRLDEAPGRQAGWKLSADLSARRVRWSEDRLPDMELSLTDAGFSDFSHFFLRQVKIVPVGGKGELRVDADRESEGKVRVSVRLKGVESAWTSLAGVILESFGHKMRLDGKGPVNGTLGWVVDGAMHNFDFDVDATASTVAVDDFTKPAGLPARLRGRYETGRGLLKLREARLGGAFVRQAVWRRSGKASAFSVGRGDVDIEGLRTAGVKLPKGLADWHGHVSGSLAQALVGEGVTLSSLLRSARGDLQLQGFGAGASAWSGRLLLQGGRAQARRMHWQRDAAFADFSAEADFSAHRGKLELRHAALDWSPDMPLPAWIDDVAWKGRFSDVTLNWSGNDWRKMRGNFSLHDKRLELSRLRGGFAGGGVKSRRMRIDFLPRGVHFDGNVRMSAVRLNRIAGLETVTGAGMDGYIFFNARLRGDLPPGVSGESWRGNGDIEIHRGRWKTSRPAHAVILQPDVFSAAANGGNNRFSLLSARFRFLDDALLLNRLTCQTQGIRAVGKARIAGSGDVRGRMRVQREPENGKEEISISGRWPSIAAFFAGVKR